MSETSLPAPLWRRLIAAVYDGLLLLGIWMTTVLVDVVIRTIAGIPQNWGTLQICVFVVWFGFFGWSWTRGGQTLGMRVWRLRAERDDQRAMTWINAAARYAATLVVWGVVLTPLIIASVPRLQSEPHAGIATPICGALIVIGLISVFFDRRQRTPQDWLSGTVTVVLPKPERPEPA